MTARALTGWARTAPTVAEVVPLGSGDEPVPWASAGRRGLLARGLGRSYGDAAQNGGGTVVDATAAARLPEGEPDADGWVNVHAGLSLGELARWARERGRRLPVEPGTAWVTVGGAIAADVHGKGHARDGSIGTWVRKITLDTPAQGRLELAPGDPEFAATVGGLGLTGVVLDADLRLPEVASSAVIVESTVAHDLDELMDRLRTASTVHHYAAAWVDLVATGARCGRGIVEAADHAEVDQLTGTWASDAHRDAARIQPAAPAAAPGWAFAPHWLRAANAARFRAHRPAAGALRSAASFHQPLDAVSHWSRVYGRRGMVQYQAVLPDPGDDALRLLVGLLAAHDAPSVLAVLKRFGPGGDGLLSFPLAGWTLAVDFPASPTLAPLLDRCDDLVVEAGGRVYLAKDSRLARRHLAAMYPRLEEWRSVRAALDPEGRLASDLDRRLDLTGRHP